MKGEVLRKSAKAQKAAFSAMIYSLIFVVGIIQFPAADQSAEQLEWQLRKLASEGRIDEAIPLAVKLYQLNEIFFGKENPNAARCLVHLADLYYAKGDLTQAEALVQQALKIYEKTINSYNDPYHLYCSALDSLAKIYCQQRYYAKAEQLYQRALETHKKTNSSDSVHAAVDLFRLATLYGTMGDYKQAKPLLVKAMEIQEKSQSPDVPTISNLAWVYGELGDYANAELLYKRAIEIREKTLDAKKDRESTDAFTNSLRNLAILYCAMGDTTKAESLIKQALAIREKIYGKDHYRTADSLQVLANCYLRTDDYTKAEPLLQRALEIYEKVYGPDHDATVSVLSELASVHYQKGDHEKAKLLTQRVLAIVEKSHGSEHIYIAHTLQFLALLYQRTGDYTNAEPFCQRALKITEKVDGPDHPDTADCQIRLASLYLDLGKTKEAEQLAIKAQNTGFKVLENILSFTSEQQRLAYQTHTNPYTILATVGNAREVALAILRNKGVVLDSLLEDHLVAEASQNPKYRAIIDQLHLAKRQLTQTLFENQKSTFSSLRGIGSTDISSAEINSSLDNTRQPSALPRASLIERTSLSKKVEELEATLAREVTSLGRTRRALGITIEQVQAALPKQAALIEFLHYHHYVGKNSSSPHYGAIIITQSGEPQWVPLGGDVNIGQNIRLYSRAVRGATNEETLSKNLHDLYKQIWAPIGKVLPADTKAIIISPDNDLNFISMATLLAEDDQFLAEKYSVHYVASGRDLLRQQKISGTPLMTIYANPDFGNDSPMAEQNSSSNRSPLLRSFDMRDLLQGVQLPSLPGTIKESQALKAIAAKWNWQTEVFTGVEATEARLRKVQSPRILHLATHGFFLSKTGAEKLNGQVEKDKDDRFIQNPMRRSGLVLAGAKTTMEAWKKGQTPPTDNDGILTAEEMGELKLNNTWLVTLSACETGRGEVKSGEGVMGLRRGFIQAGAQNLLMTLWPIADEETAKMMLEFYEAAQAGGHASQALADTQRNWLIKLRKEKSLLEAVKIAGPFILSSQGELSK